MARTVSAGTYCYRTAVILLRWMAQMLIIPTLTKRKGWSSAYWLQQIQMMLPLLFWALSQRKSYVFNTVHLIKNIRIAQGGNPPTLKMFKNHLDIVLRYMVYIPNRDILVMDGWLEWMISEVFSSLGDHMILWIQTVPRKVPKPIYRALLGTHHVNKQMWLLLACIHNVISLFYY